MSQGCCLVFALDRKEYKSYSKSDLNSGSGNIGSYKDPRFGGVGLNIKNKSVQYASKTGKDFT